MGLGKKLLSLPPPPLSLLLPSLSLSYSLSHAGGARRPCAGGEAEGQAAVKMALIPPEGIPLELLSNPERKRLFVLTQHALVTVDGMGLGTMHALTQEGWCLEHDSLETPL
jgi:hypothetical protein